MFLMLSADFFAMNFLFFKKNLSGTQSECQAVCIWTSTVDHDLDTNSLQRLSEDKNKSRMRGPRNFCHGGFQL